MKTETDVFGIEKSVVSPLVHAEKHDNEVAATKLLCTQFCTGTTCLCATSD
jgi:hypothetical protein